MSEAPEPAWPVAVFAHNEAANIVAALDCLFAAAPGQALAIYVLANGCSDNTEDLVRQYSIDRPEVQLVSIAVGDKANAWNHFVHDLGIESGIFFFTDGDVRASANALQVLADALQKNRYANAAAAVPYSGRNQAAFAKSLIQSHGIAGNLYAVRGDFIARIRQRNVRFPVGLVGEDGFLGSLLKWNLETNSRWDNQRIVPCRDAGFLFDSLRPSSLAECRVYWRRRIRYSLRHFEMRMTGNIINKQGVDRLPPTVEDLYATSAGLCRLKWRGLDTLTDMIALRRIRRIAGARANQN